MTLRFDAGASWRDHAFGWGQLLYAGDGLGHVTTDDARWILPPAGALWMPPGQRHVLRCVSPLTLHTLYFPAESAPLPPEPRLLQISPLLRELLVRVASTSPRALASPREGRLLAVLVDELEAAPPRGLHLPLPPPGPARDLAEAILADPSVPLVRRCAEVGASRRTIERHMLAGTGTTLGAWHRLARLQASLPLLERNETVEATARAVGYASGASFVAAFRACFGETPGRWR